MASKTQHQEITPSLSRDEVARGRAQVASELDSAQALVDAAAYRAALKREPEHREALVAAQQRLAALQAELSALDAVGREVVRVERGQGQHQALAEIAELEAQATKLIDKVPVAYAAASQALAAFAVAWRELLQVKEAARTLVIRANPGAVRFTGGLELNGVEMAIREQVLIEFGDSLTLGGVLQRSPEQIASNAAYGVDAARRTVQAGIQEKRDQLQGVMAAA